MLFRSSDLSNILGVLSMLGATKEGSAGAKLFDWLGNKASNFFDPSNVNLSSLLGGDQRTQAEIDYSNSLGDFPG